MSVGISAALLRSAHP